MGSIVGVVGGGRLAEQVIFAKKSGYTIGIIAPAVQNATFQSNVFKALGANVLLALFNVGAVVGAGNFTAKLQARPNGGGSGDWVDVDGAQMGNSTAPDLTNSTSQKETVPPFAAATAAGAIGATANTDVVLQSDLRGADIQALGANPDFRYYCTLVSGTSVVFGAAILQGAFEVLPPQAN